MYYVWDTVQRALHVLTYLIFIASIWSRYYYYYLYVSINTGQTRSIICVLWETQHTLEIQKKKSYQTGNIKNNDLIETADSAVSPER